jgi:hypothetical protein
MENYNIQSRTWKASNGDMLRLETDGIELYIIRADYSTSNQRISLRGYNKCSPTYCIQATIGLPSLVYDLGDCKIPMERWADLSRQLINGENWQLEGKI